MVEKIVFVYYFAIYIDQDIKHKFLHDLSAVYNWWFIHNFRIVDERIEKI